MSYVPLNNDGNHLQGDALVGALFKVLDMQSKQIGELSNRVNDLSSESNQACARINDWDSRLSHIEKSNSSNSQPSFSKVSFQKYSQNGSSGNNAMDTNKTGPEFNYKEMADYLDKQVALGLIGSKMSHAIRLEVIKTLKLFEPIDHLLPKEKDVVHQDLARLAGTVLAGSKYGANVEKHHIAKNLGLPELPNDTSVAHRAHGKSKGGRRRQDPQVQRQSS